MVRTPASAYRSAFSVMTLILGLAYGPIDAHAAATDGAYGRFDGDIDLRLGAGAAYASGGPSLAVTAAALYLNTAGIYMQYADALGGQLPLIQRSIAVGVRLEPLFLGRYAQNLEQGPAHADLLLDSIGIDLGAFWEAPRDRSLTTPPGFELGLGFALPILARAGGPFIGARGALRWRPTDLDRTSTYPLDQKFMVTAFIAWRFIAPTHLVDVGDRAAR